MTKIIRSNENRNGNNHALEPVIYERRRFAGHLPYYIGARPTSLKAAMEMEKAVWRIILHISAADSRPYVLYRELHDRLLLQMAGVERNPGPYESWDWERRHEEYSDLTVKQRSNVRKHDAAQAARRLQEAAEARSRERNATRDRRDARSRKDLARDGVEENPGPGKRKAEATRNCEKDMIPSCSTDEPQCGGGCGEAPKAPKRGHSPCSTSCGDAPKAPSRSCSPCGDSCSDRPTSPRSKSPRTRNHRKDDGPIKRERPPTPPNCNERRDSSPASTSSTLSRASSAPLPPPKKRRPKPGSHAGRGDGSPESLVKLGKKPEEVRNAVQADEHSTRVEALRTKFPDLTAHRAEELVDMGLYSSLIRTTAELGPALEEAGAEGEGADAPEPPLRPPAPEPHPVRGAFLTSHEWRRQTLIHRAPWYGLLIFFWIFTACVGTFEVDTFSHEAQIWVHRNAPILEDYLVDRANFLPLSAVKCLDTWYFRLVAENPSSARRAAYWYRRTRALLTPGQTWEDYLANRNTRTAMWALSSVRLVKAHELEIAGICLLMVIIIWRRFLTWFRRLPRRLRGPDFGTDLHMRRTWLGYLEFVNAEWSLVSRAAKVLGAGFVAYLLYTLLLYLWSYLKLAWDDPMIVADFVFGGEDYQIQVTQLHLTLPEFGYITRALGFFKVLWDWCYYLPNCFVGRFLALFLFCLDLHKVYFGTYVTVSEIAVPRDDRLRTNAHVALLNRPIHMHTYHVGGLYVHHTLRELNVVDHWVAVAMSELGHGADKDLFLKNVHLKFLRTAELGIPDVDYARYKQDTTSYISTILNWGFTLAPTRLTNASVPVRV